jgi:3,4-dihydroxy 2-butanone 4-phosphate synthase/GTP cyclohydrolase II
LRTNLKNLKEGDVVTVEPDWLAKMMQSKLDAVSAGSAGASMLSQLSLFQEVQDQENQHQKSLPQQGMSIKFHSVHELVQDIGAGKMVILIDDEDRENEGDLILAASSVTAELINFMAMHARGLICLAMAPEKIDQLGLPQMVSDTQNSSPNKTAFTVSIEAANGVSTGISAADRAHTIKVAASCLAKPSDVRMPGHIFPIRARAGGVIERPGHTEGSVELCKLAGLEPAAVICEIMRPDGEMARVPDLIEFAKRHDLKIGTIQDLIKYQNNLQPVPQAEMDL